MNSVPPYRCPRCDHEIPRFTVDPWRTNNEFHGYDWHCGNCDSLLQVTRSKTEKLASNYCSHCGAKVGKEKVRKLEALEDGVVGKKTAETYKEHVTEGKWKRCSMCKHGEYHGYPPKDSPRWEVGTVYFWCPKHKHHNQFLAACSDFEDGTCKMFDTKGRVINDV